MPNTDALLRQKRLTYLVILETWQILTVLTVLFSLLSGWFWFKSLQPRKESGEFLWIEQTKNRLVSQFQQVEFYNQRFKPIEKNVQLQPPCYTNWSKTPLDSTEINRTVTLLQEQTAKTQAQAQEKASFLGQSSHFSEVLENFSLYLSQTKQHNQEQSLTYKLVSSNLEMSLELCQGTDGEKTRQILNKFGQNLRQLEKMEIRQEWLIYSQNLLKITQSLLEVDLDNPEEVKREETQDKLAQFAQNYTDLFATSWQENSDNLNLEYKERFMRSLERLEKWQKYFLTSNPRLSKKLSFVPTYNSLLDLRENNQIFIPSSFKSDQREDFLETSEK